VLRVTTTTAKGSLVLRLEGKLGAPWVDELQDYWKVLTAETRESAIKIDMRGVSYVDRRGRHLLLRMEREGAALAECSDFIRQLLHAGNDQEKAERHIAKKTKKENQHASTVRP
jgi:hypothetical protein